MKKIFILLLCLIPCFIQAQSIQVSGKVTEKDGAPLLGVTVTAESGSVAVSDAEGNFSISAARNEQLTFTYTGMKRQVIKVTDAVISIVMEKEALVMDDIVVVGYGTMRKSDLTGAISSIKGNQLTKLSAVDINQSLQGKAAGVNVINNSGEPGAGTKIRIRGTGSVNNSDPLYVVDGFPVNDISHIAPNDVESIEILKDASAVAIYGSRGANGVIMVKTKKGTYNQKTRVNVNVFGGATEIAKKIDMLNAHEFATLKLEALKNANLTPSVAMQSILDYVIANKSVGTNWQDEILQTGYTTNYNVNVSGGSEKNKFDIGGTYSKEEGLVKNTFLDKYMVHVNNEYKLAKKVELGVNAAFTTYKKSGNDGDFYSGSLTQALKADPVSAAWDNYTNEFGEIYFSYGRSPAQSAYENKFRKGGDDRIIANAYMQINDIGIKGLSFRAQYGRQYIWSKSRSYYPVYYITADQQRDISSLTESRSDNIYWNTNEYFSYVNTFGKHSVNATLGVEAQKSWSSNMYAKVYDVPENEDLRYLGMSSNKETLEVSGGAGHNALLSGFFRANYSFDNRYLFTGTFRADGSSKFKKRWGYFPSFSLGWNMMSESFMQGVRLSTPVSTLKLRAGWGHVGNQASAGNFDYLALMTTGYTAVFGGSQVDGAIQQKLANEELSWETSEQINFGVDFGFFRNSLTGSVDYFVRNTNDMILDTPIPIYAGMWRPKTNAGSIKNSGVELMLNYTTDITQDLSLNTGFNISFIKNKVTSLGGGEPLYGQYSKTEEGKEMAYFYGLQSAGIFKSQEMLDAHVDKDGKRIQPNAGLGDVKFVDQNGDGLIDQNDRIYLGSANPDFTYGFSLAAAYKQIDLNLFLQGTKGNKIANYMYSVMYSTNMREWSNAKNMMNRWTPDNPNSDLPRVHAGDPNQNDRFSSRYVEDGSYVRLRTIQLGYTFSHLFRKSTASKARLYISADNLWTRTKYSGFNPEMGDLYGNPLNAGVDMASYPTPRVFTIGCNLNF